MILSNAGSLALCSRRRLSGEADFYKKRRKSYLKVVLEEKGMIAKMKKLKNMGAIRAEQDCVYENGGDARCYHSDRCRCQKQAYDLF
jgi:hypothetical protein